MPSKGANLDFGTTAFAAPKARKARAARGAADASPIASRYFDGSITQAQLARMQVVQLVEKPGVLAKRLDAMRREAGELD